MLRSSTICGARARQRLAHAALHTPPWCVLSTHTVYLCQLALGAQNEHRQQGTHSAEQHSQPRMPGASTTYMQ